MKKSLVELKKLIESEIEYLELSNKTLANDNNPQVKEMYIKYQARLETLQDVLYYTKTGSKINLSSRL